MRRHIAEYYAFDPLPDVVVGDDAGSVAEAGWSEDDGWVSLADPTAPDVLGFEPTWFEVASSRE